MPWSSLVLSQFFVLCSFPPVPTCVIQQLHAKWIPFTYAFLGSVGALAYPCISSLKANNVAVDEQGAIQVRTCEMEGLSLKHTSCRGP